MTDDSGNWFKRRQALKSATKAAYGSLMQAALSPRYFAAGDLNDTFEGRGQSVTLHSALLMRRLKAIETDKARKLAEAVNTKVLDGFDAAYREEGVGDSSIARKVRKLAETHYGLGKALIDALEVPERRDREAAVSDVLQRNAVSQQDRPSEFPGYLCEQAEHFRRQADEKVLEGAFDWLILQGDRS